MRILHAKSAEQMEAARQLFREYAAFLGPIECFTTLQQELATLPGEYAPPRGALLLAEEDGRYAGCAGLRPLHRDDPHKVHAAGAIGEVKRLFVRPEFRGRGVGRSLMEALIAAARRAGYARLWLDTVESAMPQAVALYRSMGFQEIERYTFDVDGAVCLGLELERLLPRR